MCIISEIKSEIILAIGYHIKSAPEIVTEKYIRELKEIMEIVNEINYDAK